MVITKWPLFLQWNIPLRPFHSTHWHGWLTFQSGFDSHVPFCLDVPNEGLHQILHTWWAQIGCKGASPTASMWSSTGCSHTVRATGLHCLPDGMWESTPSDPLACFVWKKKKNGWLNRPYWLDLLWILENPVLLNRIELLHSSFIYS